MVFIFLCLMRLPCSLAFNGSADFLFQKFSSLKENSSALSSLTPNADGILDINTSKKVNITRISTFFVPDAIRTHDLFLRRETLYPTELQAHYPGN